MLNIEVVYASTTQQWIVPVKLGESATVFDAIQASGIPGLDLTQQKVGIFNTIVSLDTPLHDGDRVEIYRPLLTGPLQKRRERASKKS